MDSIVLDLLALAVVFGAGAGLYRWGMAHRSELLGDLAELGELLGKGLITPAEHHEQRTVILRSI